METITIQKKEWQTMPQEAQKEVYDFFLFVKDKYNAKKGAHLMAEKSLKELWDNKEDEIWHKYLENETV